MRTSNPWLLAIALIGLSISAVFAGLAGCTDRSPTTTAHQLEERLVAPCCWKGTLRDHSSELAHQLRAEVEGRVAAGERSEDIEADMVRRYGEQVRALPAGSDPRWMIVAAFSALAGLGLVVLARVRRTRRSSAPTASGLVAGEAAYDQRLEDELATVD